MAVGFDNTPSSQIRKQNRKKRKKNGNTYVVHTDKLGQYVYRHQRKQVTVVALFCDCGRYVLVKPEDVSDAPIICSLCNSSFSWQQLSFPLD
jgi:hypothetical protein